MKPLDTPKSKTDMFGNKRLSDEEIKEKLLDLAEAIHKSQKEELAKLIAYHYGLDEKDVLHVMNNLGQDENGDIRG